MKVFSNSEKEVISAMYQLDRFATAYEIAEWSNLSWNTVNSVLLKFKRKGIVSMKTSKGKKYWKINEFD